MRFIADKIDVGSLELKDQVVSINRVTKVVKGGKNLSFSALVVVGDGAGHVGYGMGKAREVASVHQEGHRGGQEERGASAHHGEGLHHPAHGHRPVRLRAGPAQAGFRGHGRHRGRRGAGRDHRRRDPEHTDQEPRLHHRAQRGEGDRRRPAPPEGAAAGRAPARPLGRGDPRHRAEGGEGGRGGGVRGGPGCRRWRSPRPRPGRKGASEPWPRPARRRKPPGPSRSR